MSPDTWMEQMSVHRARTGAQAHRRLDRVGVQKNRTVKASRFLPKQNPPLTNDI